MRLTPEEARGHLEKRGEPVSVDGGALVLPLPWNAATAGRLRLVWDDVRVRAEVDLPVKPDPRARGEVATALSDINARTKLVGFRLDGRRVSFSLTAFRDPDGRVDSAVIDRLVAFARALCKTYLPRITEAARAGSGPRVLGTTVEPRPLELTRAEHDELVATLARDLPALAPLAAGATVIELTQPFFDKHRILEAQLAHDVAVQVAVAPSGDMLLLTTRPDHLARVIDDEIAGGEIPDRETALAYGYHLAHWSRPVVREQPAGAPRVDSHVSGYEVVYPLVSDGERVERHVLVNDGDGSIETRDDPT
jgi:hypothetical protein